MARRLAVAVVVLLAGLAGVTIGLAQSGETTGTATFTVTYTIPTVTVTVTEPTTTEPEPSCVTFTGGDLRALVQSLPAGGSVCLAADATVSGSAVTIVRPNVTVRAAPGSTPAFSGAFRFGPTADGGTLAGLTIHGAASTQAWAVMVQADDVTLADLDIDNRKTGGTNAICVVAGTGFETNPANTAYDLLVERSRIHDCGNDDHEHALYLESTRDAVIRDNVLYDNPGMGLDFYPDAQGTLAEFNTIDGNSRDCKENVGFSGEQAGGEYEDNHASSNNVVRTSLITNAVCRYNVDDYYPAPFPLPVGNIVADSCVFNAPYGNFGHGTPPVIGYTTARIRTLDPLYLDREGKDFRLEADSPCAGWGAR